MLSHISSNEAAKIRSHDSEWQAHPLPSALKIHESVIAYVSKLMSYESNEMTDKEVRHFAEGYMLTIEFNMGAIKNNDFLSRYTTFSLLFFVN